tara:strand:- start:21 stop:434 length:414 start_codon:yes stop_codon:yes gene_type:complete
VPAFEYAWGLLKGDVIRKTLVDMVLDAQPHDYGTPEYEQRDKEINEALEKIAQANGITTADLYRWADIGGHPDDPFSAVHDMLHPHGVEADAELMRISDEWDANFDHPGGKEHLDSINPNLGMQIKQAMDDFWRRDG